MEVELDKWELLLSAQVGVFRTVESIVAKHRNKAGCKPEDAYKHSILGAQAEAAVAKALGVYNTCTVNTFKSQPDLPPNLEIRCRAYQGGELIVRDDDSEDANYILVTGTGPKFNVRGFLPGAECKKPEWYYSPNDRPPCFWIPASELRPISELPVDRRAIDR